MKANPPIAENASLPLQQKRPGTRQSRPDVVPIRPAKQGLLGSVGSPLLAVALLPALLPSTISSTACTWCVAPSLPCSLRLLSLQSSFGDLGLLALTIGNKSRAPRANESSRAAATCTHPILSSIPSRCLRMAIMSVLNQLPPRIQCLERGAVDDLQLVIADTPMQGST